MRIIALIVSLIATPAYAQFDLTEARDLGRLLAFEQPCSLIYDYDALVAFTKEMVDGEETEFNLVVQSAFDARTRELQRMTSSMLIVQCTQIEQTARSFGFIE